MAAGPVVNHGDPDGRDACIAASAQNLDELIPRERPLYPVNDDVAQGVMLKHAQLQNEKVQLYKKYPEIVPAVTHAVDLLAGRSSCPLLLEDPLVPVAQQAFMQKQQAFMQKERSGTKNIRPYKF